MKKYPIILALLLFFLLGTKKAAAVETVVKLTTSDIFQQIPKTSQLKSTFNIRCNNETNRWIDKLTIDYNTNYVQSGKSYSDCHGDLSIGSFAIHNNAPAFSKDGNIYFFLNFVITLQEYSESSTLNNVEGTGWLVRSTKNVDNAGSTSWISQGFSSKGMVVGFDTTVNYIGDADSEIYEDGSGRHYLPGGKMYDVRISGQLWPNQYLGGSGWDIMVGNNSPGYDINDIITFSMPQYRDAFGYRITIGHPSLYYLNPNTLDEVARLNTAMTNQTDRIVAAINNLVAQQQSQTDQIVNNQTQIAQQQEQAAQQRQQEMMNDNTATGESAIASYMLNFDDGSDPTLAGIFTKPLELIQALTTTACVPLVVQLPYTSDNLTLPCGRALINQYFPAIIAVWDVFSIGLIAYWIGTKLFVMIHEFKNPDNDGNVEPLEL